MGAAPLTSIAPSSRPRPVGRSTAGRRTRRRNMERDSGGASRATTDERSRRQFDQPRTLHRTTRQTPSRRSSGLGSLHPAPVRQRPGRDRCSALGGPEDGDFHLDGVLFDLFSFGAVALDRPSQQRPTKPGSAQTLDPFGGHRSGVGPRTEPAMGRPPQRRPVVLDESLGKALPDQPLSA